MFEIGKHEVPQREVLPGTSVWEWLWSVVPGVSERVYLHGQLDEELYMGEGGGKQVSTWNRVPHFQKGLQNGN